MKVSICETFVGKAVDWTVYLNGNKLVCAIEADDEKGEVTCIAAELVQSDRNIATYRIVGEPFKQHGTVTLECVDEYGNILYRTQDNEGKNKDGN